MKYVRSFDTLRRSRYGTHFISCPGPDGQQDWYVSPWDPSTIKAGDEVGVPPRSDVENESQALLHR